MLLGGSSWKDAIKDFADAHGIVLVATGNDSRADMFRIASEKYNVDSTDHEAMKRLIRDKNIDGVYLGGTEKVISQACHYVNELGLPCYCTPEQWETLHNKAKFKDLCSQFGLPCAKEYQLDDPDITYPVVVKPTDGHSGIGITICNNAEELQAGYAIAKKASPSGTVMIEQFVNNDSIYAYYTFSNGEVYFSALDAKYSVKYSNPDAYICLRAVRGTISGTVSRISSSRCLSIWASKRVPCGLRCSTTKVSITSTSRDTAMLVKCPYTP